jgi:AAA15 family ATPase/GTPase
MIKGLKLKEHKGVRETKLLGLSQINTICGKNDSGKTSILESINLKGHYILGVPIESIDQIKNILTPFIKNKPYPLNEKLSDWFIQYFTSLIESETIWFEEEVEKIYDDLKKQIDVYFLDKNGTELINYKNLIKIIFKNFNESLHAELIPTRREMDFEAKIDSRSKIESLGPGTRK